MELIDLQTFRNKRIFITGHSGFKGSWLTSWLEILGAEVFGYSDFSSNFEHHLLLNSHKEISKFDVRDLVSLRDQITKINPDLIIHLAAQPLVSIGYQNPTFTWDVNINGTLNILKSLESAPNLRGVVIVTSDKVYLDDHNSTPHLETDPLGGHDPYSASKAAVEMLVQSYLNCNKTEFGESSPILLTARAGNVIGGGDFSRDRLFPDIYNSIKTSEPLLVRMPNAVRPWQHVLDCIYGYMVLAARILSDRNPTFQSYNFGPSESESLSVSEIIALTQETSNIEYTVAPKGNSSRFHERHALQVISTRAHQDLGWNPKLTQNEAIKWTLEWYERFNSDKIICTKEQIEQYSKLLAL